MLWLRQNSITVFTEESKRYCSYKWRRKTPLATELNMGSEVGKSFGLLLVMLSVDLVQVQEEEWS